MTLRVIYLALATCCLLFSCSSDTSSTTSDEGVSTTETTLDSADYFEQTIINNPTSPVSYLSRAGWHLRNGRITEGVNDLDMALEADSTFGPAWSAKADALYLLNEFEPCIKHLDVCIKYSPNHIPCKLRRSELYIHLNQFELAFDLLNDALKIDDQLHEVYWMKGQIYSEIGDIEKALSSYQTAVEVNPNFFDGYIKLGIANAALGNAIAEEYYNAAITIRPKSVEAKYNLAMYLQEKADYIGSLSLYEEILELDSINASAAFNSGYIHLEYKQDYLTAEKWFTKAIDRLPYYHHAFFNRGLCRESMEDLDGALQDYNEALRLEPTFDAAAIAKGRILDSKN